MLKKRQRMKRLHQLLLSEILRPMMLSPSERNYWICVKKSNWISLLLMMISWNSDKFGIQIVHKFVPFFLWSNFYVSNQSDFISYHLAPSIYLLIYLLNKHWHILLLFVFKLVLKFDYFSQFCFVFTSQKFYLCSYCIRKFSFKFIVIYFGWIIES